FGFLQSLQGYKKGDKVKGIQYLKKYLQQFGYLNSTPTSSNVEDDDLFDETIESAIKTYQINFNLKPSGILDPKTTMSISTMSMPRCGVPDIINGSTRMRADYVMHKHGNNSRALYAFYPGKPRWSPSKKVLNYSFKNGTRGDVHEPIRVPLSEWGAFTMIGYSLGLPYEMADIKISFEKVDHGDGSPFDGPGGVLAHSSRGPPGRTVHFDATENWSVGAKPNAFDLGTVGLHELGHIMVLAHSSVKSAIMYPKIPMGATKGLGYGDIYGIRALY
ncbi:LOW QUALITY PROTEIN: Peptidase_M10 domain-containing protein/PG_binding_1 domain-containing protein, partial [Cephalotus follicularis]